MADSKLADLAAQGSGTTVDADIMYIEDGGVAKKVAMSTLKTYMSDSPTLVAPAIATGGKITDAGGDEYVVFTEAATPVTYIGITSGNTGVAPKVQGAGETNTDLHLLGSGTGNVFVSDGTDPTKDLNFELSGATTAKTMTIASSQTDDRTLTLPDATDTLVGKATTDTLTNKTLTSPTIATPLLDDGDAGLTITSANQTHATPTATIPDIGDAADSFVMNDTTATLTNKTLTSPTITTPLFDDGDAGLTVTSADQTHATPTATIPDIGDAADSFVMNDTAATLTNKSLTLPKLSVAAGVTAAVGSSQGDGPITTDVVQISTCANPGDAVTLPTAAAGLKIHIINNGAQSCDVFPASGDNAGGGVDTAVALAAGANITYVAYDATNWVALT